MTHDEVGVGYADHAARGIVWTTAQKWAVRLTGLLTIAILTRVLTAKDFGIVAVALTITPFVQLLADLGFSSYLVQMASPNRRAFNTAFWYSCLAGLMLAGAMVLFSPLAESLFDSDGVAIVIASFAPAVVCVALGSVPLSILRQSMRFRALAVLTLIAAVAGQVVAIVLALGGFGVWALVGQTLVTQFVSTLCAWIASRWWPRLEFSIEEFRRMVAYGVNVLGAELVAVARLWAENAIIASSLGLEMLGFLSIAQRLVQLAADVTTAAVMPVTTVVFARIRTEPRRLSAAYMRAQAIIYALVVPAMVVVTVGAPRLIAVLFGHQWDLSVIPAQALSIAGILVVGAMLDGALFYGLGRPGTWLGYALVIDVLTVLVTLLLVRRGLVAVTVGFVGVALVATVVRWPLVARQLHMSPVRLIPPFLAMVAMAVVLALAGEAVSYLVRGAPDLVVIAAICAAVAGTWVLLLRFVYRPMWTEITSMAVSVLGRGKGRATAGDAV